jgi:hypothetical protein
VQLLAEQQLLTAGVTADMVLCDPRTASQLPLQHRQPDSVCAKTIRLILVW